MRVVFGTPDANFVGKVADKLEASGRLLMKSEGGAGSEGAKSGTGAEILVQYDEYILGVRHTPDVPDALADPGHKW